MLDRFVKILEKRWKCSTGTSIFNVQQNRVVWRLEDIFLGQVKGRFASLKKRKGYRSYEFKLDRLCHWTNLVVWIRYLSALEWTNSQCATMTGKKIESSLSLYTFSYTYSTQASCTHPARSISEEAQCGLWLVEVITADNPGQGTASEVVNGTAATLLECKFLCFSLRNCLLCSQSFNLRDA
jgi:hypothetical protein